MGKEEYGSSNIYSGANYGLDSDWGKEYGTGVSQQYAPKAGAFGFTTDPRTANQLKAVSDKLNTGAKNIEMQAIQMGTLDMIPKQHFKEIERLRKLVGSEITLHGPLVDPTGIHRRGWNEFHREHAEKQIYSAIERAQQLDSKGNVVVTFHSSNLPGDVLGDEVIKNENGQEIIKEVALMNIQSGNFTRAPIEPNFFKGENKIVGNLKEQKKRIKEEIVDQQNKEAWFKKLFAIAYHANQGAGTIRGLEEQKITDENGNELEKGAQLEMYKKFLKGEDFSKELEIIGEPYKSQVTRKMEHFVHGDAYLRDAYQDLQNIFNEAYTTAQKNNSSEDVKKLEAYREEIKDKLKYIEDPAHLAEFGEVIIKGVSVLRSINTPKELIPYRDFAVDKSSDTFSNAAFSAYKKFKGNAPIISIENPPAGSSPLDKAEDLRDIVKMSRDKLTNKFVAEMGMSKSEAEKEAEKLIGVTWDVGHINMIRKYGYDEADVVKQAEIVAPYVKHVHLSDNFGLEHTELPMGMGNVPIKKILELKKGFEKAKKIVETGAWFGPQGFGNQTPFRETLRAFGSPVYSMQMGPTWNKMANTFAGYNTGFGSYLPERYFSNYGSSFANLPVELGGQSGGGRNRLGGAPIE